jgi:hypothetical protein
MPAIRYNKIRDQGEKATRAVAFFYLQPKYERENDIGNSNQPWVTQSGYSRSDTLPEKGNSFASCSNFPWTFGPEPQYFHHNTPRKP